LCLLYHNPTIREDGGKSEDLIILNSPSSSFCDTSNGVGDYACLHMLASNDDDGKNIKK
jgi:hypothetical protein